MANVSWKWAAALLTVILALVPFWPGAIDPVARTMLNQALSCAVVGSPETVKQGVEAFIARTGADELMVTAQVFDHAARMRSFEMLADIHRGMSKAA